MAFKYNIIKMVEDEREEGRTEGGTLKEISQLQKKYRKGKTVTEAAEDLEEEVSEIEVFYDLIARHPEEDAEGILDRYRKELSMTR